MSPSLLTEHKTNRVLSAWRSCSLALRNRLTRAPCVSADGPVVCVTSHGYRLRHVHLTLEAIAAGTIKPGRLLLCLDEEDSASPLARPLRRLQRRGLEILRAPHCGPHQKYFAYVQQADTLERPLVTADDDVLYPSTWLEGLVTAHHHMPHVIHCYRAHRVLLHGEGLAAYRQWPPCTDTGPSPLNFATGVSGVIYPATFQGWLRQQGRGFDRCCPKADDVWLHVNALRCGLPVAQIQPDPVHFVGAPRTRKGALHRHNVADGGNDQQITATYTLQDVQLLRQAIAASKSDTIADLKPFGLDVDG